MFQYVWRQLFQRKVRTLLSMLGVAVAVAGIVSLISVARGMRTSLDTYMETSGASLIVFSRDAADLAFSKIRQSEVDAIAALDGVQDVSRANFTMVMMPRLGEGHKKVPMLICFGRFFEERIMRRYEDLLLEGRLPRTRAEILAGSRIARDIGLKVGDRLPIFRSRHMGVEEYEVVGVYQSEIPWENSGAVVHGDVIREETGKKDTYALLFVYTAPSSRGRVRGLINRDFEHLIALSPSEFTTRFSDQFQILDDFILLITIIALVVGVLGVLNTMMMSVAERTREIGMLRALGWSRGLIVRAIVSEGVLLSLVGGALGLAIGVAGTEVLIRTFPGGYLEALYETATFVKGAVVALVVGVLAAVYPALRAANLRPVEALRYE